VVPDTLQLRGHLLRESLEGAEAEYVGRVPVDELGGVPRAAGVADHVAGRVAAAVTGRLGVAGGAVIGVRPRLPRRDVAGPHQAPLGVRPDQIRAWEAGEPTAIADVRSSAVGGVERVREDRITARDRSL